MYWKDWDELKDVFSNKEDRKEAKTILEREYLKLEKEEPKLYKLFNETYESRHDKEKIKHRKKIRDNLNKVVDDIIEYETTEVHFPENYGD